jgi:hypothetical protein
MPKNSVRSWLTGLKPHAESEVSPATATSVMKVASLQRRRSLFKEVEPVAGTPACRWLAEDVDRSPTEQLIPHLNYPRFHSKADIDKMAAFILEFRGTIPVPGDWLVPRRACPTV